MASSVILSILALYFAGIIFILAGLEALKKFKTDQGERRFGYGAIFMGIVIGPLMGTRTIFGILGYHSIDFAISAFDQVILALSIIAFGSYFVSKTFKGKFKKAGQIFFLALGLFILVVLVWALKAGFFTGPHISQWGTEYEPIGPAKFAFMTAWFSIVAFNFLFLLKRLKDWLRTKILNYDFYVGLTLLVFFFFFVFEELGQMNTWKLVFSRITLNAFAVIFYLLYTKESFKEK